MSKNLNGQFKMQIEAKVEGLRLLKSEVDNKMAIVREQLDSIRTIIRENLMTRDNKDGVLVSAEADYFKCVEL